MTTSKRGRAVRHHDETPTIPLAGPQAQPLLQRILVCLGAGGVGKTTVAAALGVAHAEAGRRAVVLTIDPAHRLADILGTSVTSGALGNEPHLVAGPWPGELWAAMLDPTETFESVVQAHRGPDADGRLDSRLLETITGSLSGTNEYMAAERLHQLHHDPRFDHLVIDTPPSRHAIDFLDSPARLARFVDNRLFGAVLSPGSRLFNPAGVAARLVARLVSRLVGSDLLDQVIEMFAELDGLAEGFRHRADETAELLTGSECAYLLVTSGRREPLQHAQWIAENLEQRDLAVAAVVANRLTPFRGTDADLLSGGNAAERSVLAENLRQLGALAEREKLLVAELAALAGSRPPVQLAERDKPMAELSQLVELANDLAKALY